MQYQRNFFLALAWEAVYEKFAFPLTGWIVSIYLLMVDPKLTLRDFIGERTFCLES